MPYLKKPLDPQLTYSFFSNNQNKQDNGLLSADRLQGAFADKFVPYNCYPEFGGLASEARLIAQYYDCGFPCVLTNADQTFSRDNEVRNDRRFITIPIVMVSDISPFGTYYLEYDGNRYDLQWLTYNEAQCQADYGVTLDQLYTVQTEPSEPHHNTGILYLALEFNGDPSDESQLYSYITKENTTLWVEVGEPGKSQKRKVGTALKYVDNDLLEFKNYVKLSVVDSDRKTVLGFKNIDKYTTTTRQAYLRISFTNGIKRATDIKVTSTPLSFNQEQLPATFLDAFQPQVTDTKQYYVAQADAADFGATGTHSIPVDTIEHFIPITLNPGSSAQACMYSIEVSNEGLAESDQKFHVVNNDVLVLARSYAYGNPAPRDFAYAADYRVESLDGNSVFSSGRFYGDRDLRSEVPPNGNYALVLNLLYVDKAEYILRAQNNLALSTAKRPVRYGQLNWCTHDLLSGNPYFGVPFGDDSTELRFRINSGETFALNSLLPFVDGTKNPVKNASIII